MSVVIIAEAGVNHNGSLDLAKKLIDAAVDAKADYVKFQTFKATNLASKFAAKADYQLKTTEVSESQQSMLKRLELSVDMHHVLIDYCNQKGIAFLSTPFDLDSIDLLTSVGVEIGKIPSGEITNLPYLRKMAKSFRQLILSTGMATSEDIAEAIKAITAAGLSKENIIVLHCTTEYPTPFDAVNLKAMVQIKQEFDIQVGYSDHTLGIEVPIAAVALGAQVIEKHFTLDKTMDGPDHKASLDPEELKAMVKAIRNIEASIGDGIKKPSEVEIKNIEIVRKSIVAAKSISKGDLFNDDNLTVKRPGSGISPMKWDLIIGQVANRDYEEDELIVL